MTIRRRIPLWQRGKVVYVETTINPNWADPLFDSLVRYKSEEIPVNHQRSPFEMIMPAEKIRELPPHLAMRRRCLPFETASPPFRGERIVPIDIMIMLRSKRSLAFKFLTKMNPQSIASIEADCIALAKGGAPVILIVESDMLYHQIFNQSAFLGKRVPMLTLQEIQILIQGLFFTHIQTISRRGNPINFFQLIQGLDRQFQRWELPITSQEAQQIMTRMGLRPQPPREDRSVFGPQGSHRHIAHKNASEIKVGIVGLGERGIGMLKRYVDTNPHTQPKNQRFMEVVAVCDRDPKAIKNAWKKSGMKKLPKSVHPRIYNRFEDFLRDSEMNMVNIAVPPGIDDQMAQQLSLAGKAPQLIVKDDDPRVRRRMRR